MKKTFIHWLVLGCVSSGCVSEGARGMPMPEDGSAGRSLLTQSISETIAVTLDEPTGGVEHRIRAPNIFKEFVVTVKKEDSFFKKHTTATVIVGGIVGGVFLMTLGWLGYSVLTCGVAGLYLRKDVCSVPEDTPPSSTEPFIFETQSSITSVPESTAPTDILPPVLRFETGCPAGTQVGKPYTGTPVCDNPGERITVAPNFSIVCGDDRKGYVCEPHVDVPHDDVPRDDVPRDDVPRDDVPFGGPQGAPQAPPLWGPVIDHCPAGSVRGAYFPLDRSPCFPGQIKYAYDAFGRQIGWSCGDKVCGDDGFWYSCVQVDGRQLWGQPQFPQGGGGCSWN